MSFDAMIDEIFPDRVVASGRKGDFELGADAIGGTDEDRIAPTFQGEASAEAADRSQYVGVEGCGGVTLDAGNRAVGFVDIDSGLAVSGFWPSRSEGFSVAEMLDGQTSKPARFSLHTLAEKSDRNCSRRRNPDKDQEGLAAWIRS